MHCTSAEYYLTTIEYTKDNNTKGFKRSIPAPDGGWKKGWNYINFEISSYQDASNTPWDNMTRIEFYRSGDSSGVDTSQEITIKNLRFRKHYDNREFGFKLENNGILRHLSYQESNKADKSSRLLNYEDDWEIGTSGSQGSFRQNGSTDENQIILGEDPFGNKVPVWYITPDSTSGPDGGWNASYNDDPSHKIRMSLFVKRTGDTSGSTYFGCDNGGNTLNLSGSSNGNPYFWSGDLPHHDGRWYLMVGVVHPNSYTGGDTGVAGVYDMSGNRVINATEYKWGTGTRQEMRAYLYYCTNTSNRQYFAYPRVDVIDGSEPSIKEIVNGVDYLEYISNSAQVRQRKYDLITNRLKEV